MSCVPHNSLSKNKKKTKKKGLEPRYLNIRGRQLRAAAVASGVVLKCETLQTCEGYCKQTNKQTTAIRTKQKTKTIQKQNLQLAHFRNYNARFTHLAVAIRMTSKLIALPFATLVALAATTSAQVFFIGGWGGASFNIVVVCCCPC